MSDQGRVCASTVLLLSAFSRESPQVLRLFASMHALQMKPYLVTKTA
jgi:hypothetical protein